MDTQVLVDIGTLNSAYGVLNRRSWDGYFGSDEADLHIIALASLFESIVFFDRVIVPGVPHHSGEKLASVFGSAIEYRPVDFDLFDEVEDDATEWVCESVDIQQALDAIHQTMHFSPGTSSDFASISLAYGFDKKRREILPFDSVGFQERWISPSSTNNNEQFYLGLPIKTLAEFREKIELHLGTDVYKRDSAKLANAIYWTLFRCRCYDILSRLWEIPYCPHPLRARGTLLSQTRGLGKGRNPYMTAVSEVLEEARSYINSKTGNTITAIRYSPILPFLLGKCKKKSEIMPRLYEIRDSDGARSARERIGEYNHAVAASDLKAAVKLANEIQRLTNYFRSDLGLPLSAEEVTIAVSCLSVPVPQRLVQAVVGRIEESLQRRTLFIRNVFKDVASAATLSSGYELLTRGDDVLPLASGWTPEEMKNHVAHRYRQAIKAGESTHDAMTLAYKLARKMDPSLGAKKAWTLVMDACNS